MNPIQLALPSSLIKFVENPIVEHRDAQTPIIRNNMSEPIYSNAIPVKAIEIAVVPTTDIWNIANNRPLISSGTTLCIIVVLDTIINGIPIP